MMKQCFCFFFYFLYQIRWMFLCQRILPKSGRQGRTSITTFRLRKLSFDNLLFHYRCGIRSPSQATASAQVVLYGFCLFKLIPATLQEVIVIVQKSQPDLFSPCYLISADISQRHCTEAGGLIAFISCICLSD